MSKWPDAGPSEYWLLASSPASKVKTAIHTLYSKHTKDDDTHKTTTTIHTRQLTTIHTRYLKIQSRTKGKQHQGKKILYVVLVIFPTKNLITLSPQPFTSHHFITHVKCSHKVIFPLLYTTINFTSLHFTSLHSTSLHFKSKERKVCICSFKCCANL